MTKKIVKYLDNHRLLLILLILLIISVVFISIRSVMFFHHNFEVLTCKEIEEETCNYKDKMIYKDPEKKKEEFFKNNSKNINQLVRKYDLPKYSIYTSYYYEIAALINFNETEEQEELYLFFHQYNNSYQLKEFYEKNIIYYNLFYHYKIV